MKNTIKQILKKNFSSLAFFYSHLRYRITILLIVSILVGLMDGLGLAMFLPMLEIVANQDGQATADQMGSLAFILEFIHYLGFNLTLTVVLTTIFLFFLFKGTFKWLEQYLSVIYLQFFVRKLRIKNIDDLSEFRYDLFVNTDAGRIQNTMSGEVGRVVAAYRFYSQMLQQLIMVFTYVVLAFMANPEFAGLVLVGGVTTNFLFNVLYKKTKKLSNRLVTSGHDFQGLLIQQVTFFKYLKATGQIKKYAKKLKEKVYEIEQFNRKMGILDSYMIGLREPVMIGVVIGVILIQINLIGGSLATIILSILFFYRGLTSVMLLQTSYNSFLAFSGSLVNINDFAYELQNGKEKKGKIKFTRFSDKIELENLSFGYYPGCPILNNVNLQIKKNETIALVGESGSGKTTLMNLISGLVLPSTGTLTIDSTDIKQLDTDSYQRRIGYITQEPVVFDDTVYNNVTFWDKKTPENLLRFEDAIKKASIWEFIMGHKEKENIRLGNNGINLSGGQKQRISIARELYKDVDFLFMDEATSALDTETERIIQENIEKLKGKYTILIIAHRLSTIKNADYVVVLYKGRIEHIGSYEDLFSVSDSFRRMVELQDL